MFEPDEKPKYFCHHCASPVTFLGMKAGRRDECAKCGSELHVCLNCEYYDPRLTRGCRETQAEEVRDVGRANFCSWFTYRVGAPSVSTQSEQDKAKAAFDSLFKK